MNDEFMDEILEDAREISGLDFHVIIHQTLCVEDANDCSKIEEESRKNKVCISHPVIFAYFDCSSPPNLSHLSN